MNETAELAGYPGILQQAIDPADLPESFEWHTDATLLSVPLDDVAARLEERAGDPKGAPLAFPNRAMSRDVLVEIAEVRRDGDGLLAVLRERAGSGAPTMDDSKLD